MKNRNIKKKLSERIVALTELNLRYVGFGTANTNKGFMDTSDPAVLAILEHYRTLDEQMLKKSICHSIHPYMPYDLDQQAIEHIEIKGFCAPEMITIDDQGISFMHFSIIMEVEYKDDMDNLDDETSAEIRGELLDLLHVDLVLDKLALAMDYAGDVNIVDIDKTPRRMTAVNSGQH